MDNLLYIAMSGAKNVLLAQNTNANNLANANTFGFKADLDYFSSEPVYGPGHPSRAYAEDSRAGFDKTAGSLIQTGNPLDIGIGGEGWIGVQSDDGTPAYTRRGDLRVDSSGLLLNGEGRIVLGNGGPITIPPNESLVIGRDGTISIRPLGGGADELANIDRILLVNPPAAEMYKGLDGLFRMKNGEEAEPDAFVQITSGAIEASNVNAVEAIVNMIEYSRSFESQVKFLKIAEDLDTASTRLMSLN
ncbi:MAG: flagellar basal body rod protein FlgF [Pseudomonadota bacterium]